MAFLKQYIFHSRGFHVFLFFIQGIFSGAAQEQIDTMPAKDTIIEKIETVTGSEEEAKPEYFLKRWEFDSTRSFSERHVPDSAMNALKEDDNFWYASAAFKKEKRRENFRTPFFERVWFQTLLWLVIIAAFTAVIIWWLSESNIGFFRKKDHGISQEETAVETGDIFAINFQKEIDRAIQKGEFRLAVRLMYLRLLKDLSDKDIIQYTQDRTNFDYLSQLNPTGYYTDFFRITRNYEFSWYGQFEVDENAFRVIQNDFNHFNRKLK